MYWACDYLSMMGLMLNHVIKQGLTERVIEMLHRACDNDVQGTRRRLNVWMFLSDIMSLLTHCSLGAI